MAVLKLFADATMFLSADDLDIHDPGDRETIQMANLASMCASFYGPGGPTMATAHDNFLKIMIPENGIITEDISALYLDQKTQSFLAYANVMEDKESTRNSLMDKFFPMDLEEKLKGYWRESNLALSADEFVKPFTDRRNLLKAIGHDKEKRSKLSASPWPLELTTTNSKQRHSRRSINSPRFWITLVPLSARILIPFWITPRATGLRFRTRRARKT